jgi:hypothetical protein
MLENVILSGVSFWGQYSLPQDFQTQYSAMMRQFLDISFLHNYGIVNFSCVYHNVLLIFLVYKGTIFFYPLMFYLQPKSPPLFFEM